MIQNSLTIYCMLFDYLQVNFSFFDTRQTLYESSPLLSRQHNAHLLL